MTELFLYEIKYGEDSKGSSFSVFIGAKDVIDAYNKFRGIDKFKEKADIYSIQRQGGNVIHI